MLGRCKACELESCAYQQIQTSGNCSPEECELLIVADYPKADDDISGCPLSGSQYNFLWELLNQIGVKYQVTYLVRCIPIDKSSRKYRKPTMSEYLTCINSRLVQDLEIYKPKCVIALGQNTLDTILESGLVSNKTSGSLGEFRERSRSLTCGARFLATYFPSYSMINGGDSSTEMLYKRFIEDIVYACRHAMSHRSDGLYRSMTITADQFVRISNIWINDSSIEYVSFDTESNGLDPLVKGSKITSFSVSVDGITGFNIFLYHPELDISDEERSKIISTAKELLTKKKVIAHHAKHEHRFVKTLWGFTPNITEDTMYMSYILFLAQRGISHGLKYLSGRFISMPPWEETLYAYTALFSAMNRVKNISDDRVSSWIEEYSEWINVTPEDIYRFWSIMKDPDYYMKHEYVETEKDPMYWLVPPKEMERYAGMDAVAPMLLFKKFKPLIDADEGLSEAYKRMVRCADAFANIELHGFKFVDSDRWSDRYKEEMDKHMEYMMSFPEINEYEKDTGRSFSLTSSKCMTDILYNRFHFPVLVTTSTGNPSAGSPAMIALIEKMQEEYGKDSQEPKLQFLWHLRDWKKLNKVRNDYFIGWKKKIRPQNYDGVHNEWIPLKDDHTGDGSNNLAFPNYMLHGTDSGRASADYHTIPHHSDVSRAIQSINVEHGGILLQADHSQLELRVLASVVESMYGDTALADAYREGKDIHRFNASLVFAKPMEEILPIERTFSKTISFAVCYGSSLNSVAESTGRTLAEVQNIFDTFYTSFPGVKKYIEDQHIFASKYGCIRTPMGRVRWIDGATNPEDRSKYSRAMRQAQNQFIQSTGSDISLSTIAWFNQYAKSVNLKSQIMNWVHDSITIDAAPGEWIISYYCIMYGMKYLNEKRSWVKAPWGIDVGISKTWGDEDEMLDAHVNEDGTFTFTYKGYSYILDETLEEAVVSYEIIEDELIESKEVVEDMGNSLKAQKATNLFFSNKKFTDIKRRLTIRPKDEKELSWCKEKYRLEQSGSQEMPGDRYSGTKDLF